MDKQQQLYFYIQVKALQWGDKQIPEYIQEGETLAALALNKNMVFFMAQAFINRLNNQEHKQMLDLVLPDNLYTFRKSRQQFRNCIPTRLVSFRPLHT